MKLPHKQCCFGRRTKNSSTCKRGQTLLHMSAKNVQRKIESNKRFRKLLAEVSNTFIYVLKNVINDIKAYFAI